MRAGRIVAVLIAAGMTAAMAAAAAPAAATAAGGPAGHLGTARSGAPAPGIATGLVLGPRGRPLSGACVTASGPGGRRVARTSQDGRYVLPGLKAGRYSLAYRDCAHPGWRAWPAPASRALISGPGLARGAALPSGAGPPGQARAPVAGSRIMITSGSVTRLAPVTLRPAGQAGLIRPAAPRRLTLTQLRRSAPRVRYGGIAGRVTDAGGHPVAGICVMVGYSGFSIGLPTAADGSYHIHPIPPGRVIVEFTSSCNDSAAGAGNWAPQWYKDRFSKATADRVTIRAGRTTKGIDAVMRHGGQIAGLVTSESGSRLTGVCVDILSNDRTTFVAQVKTTAGRYLASSLDPGRYRVLFDPACGYHRTPYLPQWWRHAPSPKGSAPVSVRLATVTGHVDARLVLGGKITGVVRARNRGGRPLRGICVDASGHGAAASVDKLAATGSNGRYVIEGLPPGRYSLLVGPGCSSNANFLYQRYPHPVSVTRGSARVINFYLQPGGILTGTVTAAADGTPLGGICVVVGALGDVAVTRSDGTYTLDQIPSGRYVVGFFGGCGSSGSYAPQWYPGRDQYFDGARVPITAAKVTPGIDAAMKPGATISGTVLNTAGHKVSDACVGALDAGTAAEFGALGDTLSHSGRYQIANLAAGQYKVVFFWCGGGPGYTTQWFRATPRVATAALLDVPGAAAISGIDAVLRPAGGIQGTVTDSAGNPVQFVCVSAIHTRPGGISSLDQFEFGGGYEIIGLPPGRYDVRFADCGGFGYATQWFPGKAQRQLAHPVTVTARHITTSIDAALTTGAGSISGRATVRATGKPASGACVYAYGSSAAGFARTTSTGRYTIGRLSTGSYHVVFFSCSRTGPYASVTRPGLVRVVSPKAVTGVDQALVPGAAVSGTVRSGQPAPVVQPGVCVDLVTARGGALAGFAQTGRRGRYAFGGLAPGSYKLLFGDPACSGGAEGLVPQWYAGKHTQAAATTIVVRAGQARSGVDATLLGDGVISGTVTGPVPGSTPLAGICVVARPLTGSSPVYAVSGAAGYSLTGLLPGRYRVEFRSGCGASGFAAQWWQDSPSRAGAAVVVVTAGRTLTGIDAAMRK